MTDHDLTPEQEAEVRRLLADARHTEPTPDAVVARLDRVLADLAGEPAREADVVRLADRRRRVGTILVAAAASVVAVIGVGQVVSNSGGGDADNATSADAGAESAREPRADAADRGGPPQANGFAEDAPADRSSLRQTPLALASERFADDAETLKSLASYGFDLEEYAAGAAPAESAAQVLRRVRNRTVCEPGSWGQGSYVGVLYDGAEGWVVLREPQGETQVADLFLCGSETVVRSVTLPHP
ncbi:MAG: hypothetical protein ACXWDL_04985 [Nocardioides sp.]